MSSTSQITTFVPTDYAWAAGIFDGEGCDRYMPQWRWIVYGKNAVAALTARLPYLITKKSQAEIALLSRTFLRGKHEVSDEKIEQMRWAGQKLKDLKRQLPTLEDVS